MSFSILLLGNYSRRSLAPHLATAAISQLRNIFCRCEAYDCSFLLWHLSIRLGIGWMEALTQVKVFQH